MKKYTSSEIHWRLIELGEARRQVDEDVSDDGYVAAQALFCPYYNTVEGSLGSDWGVIVNPESVKFGQLVFEHEWCGCPVYESQPHGEFLSVHGSGNQGVDEWLVPTCRESKTMKNGEWRSCIREKKHKGKHRHWDGKEWK
jgi:hypothetical protein